MRIIMLLTFFLLCRHSFEQQCITGAWTWMRGDSLLTKKDVLGNQGTLNITDSKNDPSARSWNRGVVIDKDIWFYGGAGVGVDILNNVFSVLALNDIWKYEPTSNNWTRIWGSNAIWPNDIPSYGIQGQFSNTNNPGSRIYPALATDANKNIWLISGMRQVDILENPYSGGISGTNELWMFDIQKKQWSWIWGSFKAIEKGVYVNKGSFSANAKPCNRLQAFSWFDNKGILWLYGGMATNDLLPAQVALNDVWKFDPLTNQWCWVSGDAPDFINLNNPAIPKIYYGKQDISSPLNTPGCRQSNNSSFSVVNGNLWLFGGREGDNFYMRNDLWVFDTKSETWIWKAGETNYHTYSVFGEKGKHDVKNIPSTRTGATMFGFHNSKLYLYGGNGLARIGEFTTSIGTHGHLSDLWCYDTLSRKWSWIAGDTIGIRPPVYGQLKVPDDKNNPGARAGGFGYVNGDSLLLFGGNLRNKETNPSINNYTNDVWRYTLRPVSASVSALKFQQIGKDNEISWTANTTSGDPLFILEKSNDNKTFSALTSILSKLGLNAYSYSHTNAWQNDSVLFYRIVIDGGAVCTSYSDTLRIKKYASDIWISPNPGSGTVNINITSTQKDSAIIRLISVPGVILQTKTIGIVPGLNTASFDTRFYASATYFIDVRLRDRRRSFKFIKHN